MLKRTRRLSLLLPLSIAWLLALWLSGLAVSRPALAHGPRPHTQVGDMGRAPPRHQSHANARRRGGG